MPRHKAKVTLNSTNNNKMATLNQSSQFLIFRPIFGLLFERPLSLNLISSALMLSIPP